MGKISLKILVFMMAVMLSQPAFAANELTEDNIRRFIEKTTAITSGKDKNMSSEAVKNYLDKHLHKEATFRSKMTYVIPQFPTQESALALKKEEFIDSVLQGRESISNFETDIQILSIDVSSNGKQAIVQTRSSETGQMPAINQDRPVDMVGSSTCKQILTWEQQRIQMFQANCDTKIEFAQF